MRPNRSPVSVLVLAFCVPALAGAQPTTTRVSVATGGAQGNGNSWETAVTPDGRWVAFQSIASNLVPGDTNNAHDIFLHDRQQGTTVRVSVGAGGAQGNGQSRLPGLSADGRRIVFSSFASTLVPGDTNGTWDVFVHDVDTSTTSRVSVGTGGTQGDGASQGAAISPDGRWVTFASAATNLVPDDTNGLTDVFVHDRQTGSTTRVSLGPDGIQGNGDSDRGSAISPEGRWVAFSSNASNLVAGDTNNRYDVFVRDLQTGATSRVSVNSAGVQGDHYSWGYPAISADARWVAFYSAASNLAPGDTNNVEDVFVHDRQTGQTSRVSVGPGGDQGNGASVIGGISDDGRRVAFYSWATNLVPDDTNGVEDVFVHDLHSAMTSRVSLGSGGTQSNGGSRTVALSGTGRWVLFASDANNLVPDDTNARMDVFVRDLGTAATPTGLRVHAMAGHLVTLRWTVPVGSAPTGFVLEGGINPGEVLASLPTGSADPTFTFTSPTGSFYVRVHALNGTVRSAASNEIRIHVNLPVPPSAPDNLLGLVNGSTLALAWVNTYAGGAPTSLVLDVTGALVTSLPLGLADSFSFVGVPAGTYALALRAQNAAGTSPPSDAVTLTFPGPCTGPPLTPTNLLAYRVGSTVFVDWAPAASGPAPTGYRLDVTGAFVGSFATATRAMSGSVGPGAYTLSVVATNACGMSAATVPQTVVVP